MTEPVWVKCDRCDCALEGAAGETWADDICGPYANEVGSVCGHVRICRSCAAVHRSEVANELMDTIIRESQTGDWRDYGAERNWLLRLPAGPETDRLQNEWERDPEVAAWRGGLGG